MSAYAVKPRPRILTMFTIAVALYGGSALGQVIYFEDFEDETLEANTTIVNATVANGFGSFDDPTGARATFAVVQDFTAEVMTFSFDIVEPVVEAPPRMELLFRAGVGTAASTLQSGDQIVEAIMYRTAADPTRGDYMNNGNETIFLVANNKASDLTFDSPIDGTPVTLTGFQYIPYVKDNDTGLFGQIKGISNFTAAHQPVFGTFNRFGIGSSTTGDVGTFAIDNVLVKSEVSFDTSVGPPPVLGDVDGDGVGGEFPDDFGPIQMNFRRSVSSRAQGDLVRDGVVDFEDFKEWKTVFLGGGGSLEGIDLGFAAVPEPASAGLMLAALCSCACRMRRIRMCANA